MDTTLGIGCHTKRGMMDWLTIVRGIVLIAAGVARLVVENTGRPLAAVGYRRYLPFAFITLGILFIAVELLVSTGT